MIVRFTEFKSWKAALLARLLQIFDPSEDDEKWGTVYAATPPNRDGDMKVFGEFSNTPMDEDAHEYFSAGYLCETEAEYLAESKLEHASTFDDEFLRTVKQAVINTWASVGPEFIATNSEMKNEDCIEMAIDTHRMKLHGKVDVEVRCVAVIIIEAYVDSIGLIPVVKFLASKISLN